MVVLIILVTILLCLIIDMIKLFYNKKTIHNNSDSYEVLPGSIIVDPINGLCMGDGELKEEYKNE